VTALEIRSIGAPLVGWLAEVAGPRSGLYAGAVAALATAAWARVAFERAGDVAEPPIARPQHVTGRVRVPRSVRRRARQPL
jgi:hypothetical protein